MNNRSNQSLPENEPPLGLDYHTIPRKEPEFRSMRVILPFAAGALLLYFPLGIFGYLWALHTGANDTIKEWITYQSMDLLKVLLALIWGESALLLICIKLRQRFVRLKPEGRPWWAHCIGGIVNTCALIAVIFQTTARQEFWPMLGAGGSFLVALLLAFSVSLAVARFLTPKLKRESDPH